MTSCSLHQYDDHSRRGRSRKIRQDCVHISLRWIPPDHNCIISHKLNCIISHKLNCIISHKLNCIISRLAAKVGRFTFKCCCGVPNNKYLVLSVCSFCIFLVIQFFISVKQFFNLSTVSSE